MLKLPRPFYIARFVVFCSFVLLHTACKNNKTDIIQDLQLHYQQSNDKSFFIEGYFSEANFFNGEIVSFTDATGYLISLGPDYYINLNTLVFYPKEIRRLITTSTWQLIVESAAKLIEGGGVSSGTGCPPGYTKMLNAYRRFETSGPLSNKSKGTFLFNFSQTNEDTPVVHFKSDIYEGNLFFDPKTNLIDSVKLTTCVWFSELSNDLLPASLTIHYEHLVGFSYPTFIKGFYEFEDIKVSMCFFAKPNAQPYKTIFTEDFSDLLVGYTINPLILVDGNNKNEPKHCLEFPIKTKLNSMIENAQKHHISPFYTFEYFGKLMPEMKKLNQEKEKIDHFFPSSKITR